MKAPKSVALGLATALAVGGVSIITAGAAQASSENFTVTSQIAPSYQGVAVPIGSRNFNLTVTPASTPAGSPITIALTSSDLDFVSGPASDLASGFTELNAVVALNNVDYTLRGSAIGQHIPKYDGTDEAHGATNAPTMFNPGWVISSAPGASSSTSTVDDGDGATWMFDSGTPATPGDDVSAPTGTANGSTGIGATVRGAETTPVTLKAPAAAGAYPITLKAVVVNSTSGNNSPALTDTFDSVVNTAVQTNTTVGAANNGPKNTFNNNVASSYFDFATDVVLTATPAPDATITLTTDPATPAGTVPVSTPQAVRAGDVVTISSGTNASWLPSTNWLANICTDEAGTTCAPPFVIPTLFEGTTGAFDEGNKGNGAPPGPGNPTFVAATGAPTNASGEITPTTLRLAGFANYTGTVYLKIYQGDSRADVIPLGLVTADRSASVPTGVQLGTAITVSGSNFYPGETVTLSENRVGTDGAGSDPDATAVVGANGSFSKAVVVNDATATSFTATGIGGTATTGAFAAKNLNGTFTRAPASIWATQTAKVTPSGVTADVNTVSISWGDGATTAGSKTAASTHTYNAPGTKTIKVTLKNTATGVTVVKTVGNVVVTKDTVKPVPSLTTPKKATKGSSWTTIKGKVSDKGLGAKSVSVKLIEKKGGKWYAFNGKTWKKAKSKSAALKAAKSITDTSVSTGAWSVKVKKKPAKGTLYVYYSATDKANNKSSATKYKKQTIKS